MVNENIDYSYHPLAEYICRLENNDTLLDDSPLNVVEVVGILKSYGIVLESYSQNLDYIASYQFLNFFPLFKYFNGEISIKKIVKHLKHQRINYEYAEYCVRTMMWHGGGDLDVYLDSEEFIENVNSLISTKFKYNLLVQVLHKVFPEFLIEQMRMMAYYKCLGQFWKEMSHIFLCLSDSYDNHKIKSIPSIVEYILDSLKKKVDEPICYEVKEKEQKFNIIPKVACLSLFNDVVVPYAESIFFRGTPFPGLISYNAQSHQIPSEKFSFTYGILYADPLPIGGSGVPPTLLMKDLNHYIPDYLYNIYSQTIRQEDDLLVQICKSFQKSMFCVTTAVIKGLAPYPLNTTNVEEQKENRIYLKKWMDRFQCSQISTINS